MTGLATAPSVGMPLQRGPADAEPAVTGGTMLRIVDRWLGAVDRAATAVLPVDRNPFLHLGALANWCFLVASLTGVLLLFWYTTSVHEAHASMRLMEAQPWGSGLCRNLHRYSSDACMLLVLLHATKMFFAGRFSGPRWLAWVTGLVCLLLLWLIGWLGYWLVWDQPAQHIAEGTARALDVIPLFIDPLERSFTTDSSINSLLFFLVFFVHMLLPLGLAVGLWLHITRLSRPRFLPNRTLAVASTAALIAVSVAWPATAGEPAAMTVKAGQFPIDVFYLAPLWITDRLSGGGMWLFWLLIGSLLCGIPWLLTRGRVRPANVEASRCNACTKCFQDCPYGAIALVPRTDGKAFDVQAQVDPRLCVGCGICAGSCDTAGVGLDWRPQTELRNGYEAELAAAADGGGPLGLLLACAHGAAGAGAEVPGWTVHPVPCAGWVHMLTAERALKAGAREVAIASCGDGNCRYREGDRWARDRKAGARQPILRVDRVPADRVRVVELPPGAPVEAVLRGELRRPDLGRRLAGTVAILALLVAIPLGSALPYRTAHSPEPELVISFKHPGQLTEERRELTAEEKARLPRHMQRDFDLLRTRQDVRLRVLLDGAELLTRTFPPKGLWGDGNSIALVRVPVSPGTHHIEVRIADGADPSHWDHTDSARVDFEPGHRRVVLFDRHAGFAWH